MQKLKKEPVLEVTVTLYGYVRDILKEPRVTLRLPEDAVVGDVFQALLREYGDRFRERVFTSQGALEKTVKIFIDGHAVDDLDRRLSPGGTSPREVRLVILSPFTGG